SGGFLAAFFRGGADRDEDEAESASTVRAPQPAARTAQPAVRAAEPETAVVPPAAVPAPVEQPEETPAVVIASLPANAVPVPLFAPRQPAQAETDAIAAIVEEAATVEATPKAALALNVPYPTPRPATAPGLKAIAAVMADGSSGLDEAKSILGADANEAAAGMLPAELALLPQPSPRQQVLPTIVA